jgi:hypothetical protein
MDINSLMESLSSSKLDVPSEIRILELRRFSVEDSRRRLVKVLKKGSEVCERDFDRGEWTVYDDRTFVRLPQGAHAVVYHASGAVKLATGLAPMDSVFADIESREKLAARTEKVLVAMGLRDTLGRAETLAFERLWQMKACAADRHGTVTETALCGAVGAFRQHLDGIAVLGPASAAIHILGGGLLHSVSVQMRSLGAEVIETAKVVHPERAVRQIAQQLQVRFDQAKDRVQLESGSGLRFGYLSLPKRKVQRLLAPVYMATIDVMHEQERQALVMAVPATDKNYLPLDPPGAEGVVGQLGKLASRRGC